MQTTISSAHSTAPRRRRTYRALLTAAALASIPGPLLAATSSWIDTNLTGSWSTPTNWSPSAVPTPGNNVVFAPADSGNFTFDAAYSTASPLGTFTFGSTIGFAPTLNQTLTTSDLATTAEAYDTGTFNQGAGTHSVAGNVDLAFNGADQSNFNLSGGTFTAQLLYVGFSFSGAATFSQSGGVSTFSNSVILGNGSSEFGTVSLSGGSLNCGTLILGAATFAQADVSVSSTGILDCGTTILSNATFAGGTINNAGVQSINGNLTIGATAAGSGNYTLESGGSLTVVGDESLAPVANGAGSFTQLGGVQNVAGSIFLGSLTNIANARYSVSSGALLSSAIDLSSPIQVSNAVSAFTQTGGYVSATSLSILGHGSSYTLSGGSLSAADIAIENDATLTVETGSSTSGLARVSGSITVGAVSSLTIAGGELKTPLLASTGTVQISSGTFQLTAATPAHASTLTQLAITNSTNGGRLDVTTGGFIIPYAGTSPIGELTPSKHTQTYPANSISNYLASASDGGNWDGPGITSSNAEADFTGVTAVGALDNNDLLALQGNNYTGQTWLGQPITSNNTVLVRYTYYGDTNLDGVVNSIDVDNLIQGFEGFGDGWLYGDFNYDGIVDSLDVTEMIIGYTGQGKPLGDAISPGQAQFLLSLSSGLSAAQIAKFDAVVGVPEPTTLALLTLASASLLTRRRRR